MTASKVLSIPLLVVHKHHTTDPRLESLTYPLPFKVKQEASRIALEKELQKLELLEQQLEAGTLQSTVKKLKDVTQSPQKQVWAREK